MPRSLLPLDLESNRNVFDVHNASDPSETIDLNFGGVESPRGLNPIIAKQGTFLGFSQQPSSIGRLLPILQAGSSVASAAFIAKGAYDLLSSDHEASKGVALFATMLYSLSFWPALANKPVGRSVFSEAAQALISRHIGKSKEAELENSAIHKSISKNKFARG